MSERMGRMRRRFANGDLAVRGIERRRSAEGQSMTRLRRQCASRIFTPAPDARWRAVREAVRVELARSDAEAGTDKLGLLDALCGAAERPLELCERFHIEARTFYAWRTEILYAAMLIAAEEGCFSLRKRQIL